METLSVQLPAEVMEEGLQPASMPEGIPLSTKPTVPVKLLIAEMFTVKLVLLPAVTVWELGEAEIEKSAVVEVELETARPKLLVLMIEPLLPLTLTV